MLYSLLKPDKDGCTHGCLCPQQQGVLQHHKVSKPPSSPPQAEVLMSPTQTAVICANPASNSPSNISPVTCLHHRVTGMVPWCPGENGTKTIPAQCVQAGLGHWEAGLLHGLSQTFFPSPEPCRLLSGLWAGQSPCRTGYKRMQESCDGAAATCPSKSLQKREETQSSHFHRKGNPLTIQDMSQQQETEAEKMQLLHFAAESGRGWAEGDGAPRRTGELCTASLLSPAAAAAPHCLYILPAHGFHFLLESGKL